MRILIAIVLIVLVVMQGCIRSAQEVKNENCDEYREEFAVYSCYKYQASYLAASQKTGEALQTCEKIKEKYGRGSPGTLGFISILGEGSYNKCIKEVAYYSGDENVCKNIDFSKIGYGTSFISKFFGGEGSKEKIMQKEIEECIMKVKEKEELRDQILENFKYIGYEN